MERSASVCRVCGLFTKNYFPWGLDGATPTYDICACCGVEFGYEDSSVNSVRGYRTKWIADGAKWWDHGQKPGGWNVDDQLKELEGTEWAG